MRRCQFSAEWSRSKSNPGAAAAAAAAAAVQTMRWPFKLTFDLHFHSRQLHFLPFDQEDRDTGRRWPCFDFPILFLVTQTHAGDALAGQGHRLLL